MPPIISFATSISSSSKSTAAKWKPSRGKCRKGSRSGAAKAKLKVVSINPQAIERLEVIPHCDETIPLEKGKYDARIYPGTYLLVTGKEEDRDYSDMHCRSDFWLCRVVEIQHDPIDKDVWLLVQWYWSRYELIDEEAEAAGDHIDDPYDVMQMGNLWERIKGSDDDEYLEFVNKKTVAGILKEGQVIVFDDTSLHPPPIPIADVFYVRRFFDLGKQTLEDIHGPSLCAFEACSDPRYSPDDNISQVFCPSPSCLRWSHADCLARALIDNPFYDQKESHRQGLLRSTPLTPCHPEPEAAVAELEDELENALHELSDTPTKEGELTERKVLLNLAGKPIVRPTSTSISGNIDEVLTARCWIALALEGNLSDYAIGQLRQWLASFDSNYVVNGWREANLRARGTKGSELNRMMKLAAAKQMHLRFDVCPHCGIPI